MRCTYFAASLLAALLVPTTALAQVPAAYSFTGHLSSDAGDISGPVLLTFSIYEDPAATDPSALLWSETLDVDVDQGAFVVLLGDDLANPFPPGVFGPDPKELFLGIQVEGQPEMVPRLPVASVPFASAAADAAALDGLSAGDFALAGHGHTMADIAGSVPLSSLPNAVVLAGEAESISGAMLQDGIVERDHLSGMGCDSSDVLVRTFNDNWQCRAYPLIPLGASAALPGGGQWLDHDFFRIGDGFSTYSLGSHQALASTGGLRLHVDAPVDSGAIVGGTTAVNVTSSGKVGIGIGTESPVAELQLGGTLHVGPGIDRFAQLFNAEDGSTLHLGGFPGIGNFGRVRVDEDGEMTLSTQGPESRVRALTSRFSVFTGGLTRFEVSPSGWVGMGTDAPQAHVDMAGAGSNWQDGFVFLRNRNNLDTGFRLYSGSLGTSPQWHIYNATALSNSLRVAPDDSFGSGGITVEQSGEVGIGTTTPGYLLHVNGTAAKPGGGSWTTSSDRRLKKNIRPLDSALGRLLSLAGVTYEWRQPKEHGDLQGTQIGMIAQHVQEVFPEWVGVDPQGFLNLTIRGFEALVVEALREVQTRQDAVDFRLAALSDENRALAEENAALLNQLERLTERVEALEATQVGENR